MRRCLLALPLILLTCFIAVVYVTTLPTLADSTNFGHIGTHPVNHKSPAPELDPGTVVGMVTWQYNDFVGTKGDVGATVALMPSPMKKRLDNSTSRLFSLSLFLGEGIQPSMERLGIYFGKADGMGQVVIDNVHPGTYIPIIVSNKTERNTEEPISPDEWEVLAPFFINSDAEKSWYVSDASQLPGHIAGISKWSTLYPIIVRPDKTAHFEHDFGHTY